MTNQQRRRKQRRAALTAHSKKDKGVRPAFKRARMRDDGLPPQTRRMLVLGIDRSSMAQGGGGRWLTG